MPSASRRSEPLGVQVPSTARPTPDRRADVVGERSKEASAELMTIFGERGAPPGQVAHYVFADGSGGFLITEEPD